MSNTIGARLSGRENNFDFIRFVAALAVIFSHSFYLTNTTEREPLTVFTSGRFDTASLSVATFFIISGFLITMSFQRAKSVYAYFEARFLRIYPALIVVILCTVFIIGPLLTTYKLKSYFVSSETIKYFILNTLMVKVQYTLPGVFEHDGAANTVNASLWTLPIELACYCFVAIVGLLLAKRVVASIVLGGITLLIFYYVFLNGFIALLFYFFFGAMLYVLRDKIVLNGWLAALAFILLMADLYFNNKPDSNFIIKSVNIIVKGVALSYVIMYLAFVKTTYIKNFAKKGDYSYGLYIWAFPLQRIINISIQGLGPYSLFCISAIVTLIFAVLSWHVIEKRALQLKNKLLYRTAIPYSEVRT